jgi:hypothetical protein
MLEILLALTFGSAFGFVLHKAGLTHYAVIVNVYRLRDFTVLRFMLSALIVGSVLVRLGIALGFSPHPLLPPVSALSHVAGGLLFGIGMAVAGYCPGTIVAEAGEGRYDAWLGGIIGLIVGALLFGLAQPTLMPVLARVGSVGRVDIAEVLHIPVWLALVLVVELLLLTLLVVARAKAVPPPCQEGRTP